MAKCPAAKAIQPPHFGGIGAWWGGMILPFLPFRPSAFIWHQGEENSGDSIDYVCYQPQMIQLWRQTASKLHIITLPPLQIATKLVV